MKFYIKATVEEGAQYPLAWIGNFTVESKYTTGRYLLIRFPWFKRDRDYIRRYGMALYTPAFMVSHYKGYGPEKYEWFWLKYKDCEI